MRHAGKVTSFKITNPAFGAVIAMRRCSGVRDSAVDHEDGGACATHHGGVERDLRSRDGVAELDPSFAGGIDRDRAVDVGEIDLEVDRPHLRVGVRGARGLPGHAGHRSARGRAPDAPPRLRTWARDRDFWVRRTALLAQLRALRHGGGDFALFAEIAAPMLEEREFFIRKAIGWVLREVSKKRPELVRDFLAEHGARASGLTRREASKYLPAGML